MSKLSVCVCQPQDFQPSNLTNGSSSGDVASDKKLQEEKAALQRKVAQYESGERGMLNPVFPGALRDWLDHCFKLGGQFL